jgi:1,2-phenylacetyl-CoA epoxidase PaaB subunit
MTTATAEAPGASALALVGVREEAKPSLRPVWLVMARRKYDEPLYQVGTVTAEHADMAALFAESIYDEHPWIEMIVVPRRSMRTVIPS